MEAQGLRVQDLERRLDRPTYLRNEVLVPIENGVTAVYVGEVTKIYCEELNIRGGAKLSRYDRTVGVRRSRRLAKWFPPRIERVEEPVTHDQLVWSMATDSESKFFLSDGTPTNGYGDHEYRGGLSVAATKAGILLSPELFDLVFCPIDAEIKKLHEIAKSTSDEGSY